MSHDIERNVAFLEEMGLGPLWVRRDVPPAVLQAQRIQEDPEAHAARDAQLAPDDGRQVTTSEERAPVPAPVPAPVATTAGAATDAMPEPLVPAWDDVPLPESDDDMPGWLLADAEDEVETGPRISEMGWEELERTVSNCTRCGLCRDRTKTVFGVGDRKARWLFIGEGPGREEDLRGEPFVGRAGQLLDNMLAAIKLARDNKAYIANIVKCRPKDEKGKDRRPSPEEVATCMPYLKRQIALIQPDVIVALGKTAAVSLLGLDPETPVSSVRGKVHRYEGRPLVVTYHPAYLLRTPDDKRKAWADLCLAVGEYEKVGATEGAQGLSRSMSHTHQGSY